MFQRGYPALRRWLLPALWLCLLLSVLLLAARSLERRAGQESLELTRQSIRRAAVQCYALEGAYPTGLEHLKERYGVTVDEERFFVDYQYIAANLAPDVTVLLRDGNGR